MPYRFLRGVRLFLLGIVVVSLGLGCVIDRTRQSASYKMRADVDSARDRARALEKDLARERERIDSMQNKALDARKRIAESGATLESFLEELMQVRGELSSATYASGEAARFSEDLDLRISDIEVRFMRLEEALRKAELLDDEALRPPEVLSAPSPGASGLVVAPQGQEIRTLESQSRGSDGDSVTSDPSPGAAKEDAEPSPDEVMFQRALLLVEGKSWDRAGAVLQQFIKSYPQSPWQVEALYLLGECLFHLERYRGAVRQYQKVVDAAEGADSASERAAWAGRAMLRQSSCFEAMGMADEAAVFLDDLLRLYPNSPAAIKVQKKRENAGED